MNKINNILSLSLLILALGLFSCDSEEENIGFRPGENLLISGPDELLTFEEGTFNVEGFTIDETYTWTVDGDGEATVTAVPGRDGEFVISEAEDLGDYTISVSNGQLNGSFNFTVSEVNEFLQVENDTLNLLENAFNAGGDTLFLPVNISERNVFETTASFSIVEGSAEEGTDFEVLNETNVLTFPAGETQAFVEILLYDNTLLDGSRDFSIVLEEVLTTGPKTSAVIMAPDSLDLGQTVVNINDDIKTVDLVVADSSVEVNTAGNYFIDVELSRLIADDVTITYTVLGENGLPVVGADRTGGNLTIFAGETGSRITLDIDESWVAAPAEGEEPEPFILDVELQTVSSDNDEVILGVSTVRIVAISAE